MQDLNKAIDNYVSLIKADYVRWHDHTDAGIDEIHQSMIAKFNSGISIKAGRRYIKIIADRSVHSFVLVDDFGKFKKGDILKAASFSTPATNFSRGNVFNITEVRWTGA
jgi:hypothetical protein